MESRHMTQIDWFTQSPTKAPAVEKKRDRLREDTEKALAEISQTKRLLTDELEKKLLEFDSEKKRIDKHRQEKSYDNDWTRRLYEDMRKSICQNQNNILQLGNMPETFSIGSSSMHMEVGRPSDDRASANNQVLDEKVKWRESGINSTVESVSSGQKSSDDLASHLKRIIEKLQCDLEDANRRCDKLEFKILDREETIDTMTQNLNREKEFREMREVQLDQYINAKQLTNDKLEIALEDTSLIRRQIIQLAFAIGKQSEYIDLKPFETADEWEKHLKEKGDCFYVDDSVLLIKKEFNSVETGLSRVLEKNAELEKRWDATEKDLKQYRQKCDEYSQTIKHLEKKNVDIQQSNDICILKAYKEFEDIKWSLEEKIDAQEIAMKLQNEVSNQLKNELNLIQAELDSSSGKDVLEAIKLLKKHYVDMQLKPESDSSVAESDLKVGVDCPVEQLQSIHPMNQETDNINMENFSSEEKLIELEEQLTTSRIILKKARKERDASVRKLKRKLDEVNAEKKKMLTEQSEAHRLQLEEKEKEIGDLKETDKRTAQEVEHFTKLIAEKENKILELKRAIAAQQSKIVLETTKADEKSKLILRLETRILELQRSAETRNKRNEEESTAILQKLELAESELGAQQDFNARLTVTTEEIRQRHTAEMLGKTGEIIQHKKTIDQLTEKINNMKNKELVLVATMKSEKQKISEELNTCKQFLKDAVEKSANLVEELVNSENLERETAENVEKESQVPFKFIGFQEQQFDMKQFIEKEEKKHQEIVKELERLQKTIRYCCEEHADEVAINEHLRDQILQKNIEIEGHVENADGLEKALIELANAMEQKDLEHEAALTFQTEKLEILQKALEDELENCEGSGSRKLFPKESARTISQIPKDSEDAMDKMMARMMKSEIELDEDESKIENSALESILEELKKAIRVEDVIISGLKKKSQHDSEQNAKFDEMINGKVEKVELLSPGSTQPRVELSRNTENEISTDHLRAEIKQLKEQNETIVMENKRERNGLVNELISKKKELTDANEKVRMLSTLTPTIQENDKIGEMFANWDPALRQLLRLLYENPSFIYGLLVYAILIHFYVLL